jgi:hypothetical protein
MNLLASTTMHCVFGVQLSECALKFCLFDQLFCIEWVDFGAAGLQTNMAPKIAVYTTDKLKELVNMLVEDGVNGEVKYKV